MAIHNGIAYSENYLVGKACFICETDQHSWHQTFTLDTTCSSGVPSIPLDPLKPHFFLVHMGAHILKGSVTGSD